jgi:hypothetical protein
MSEDVIDSAAEARNYKFLRDVTHTVGFLSFYCIQYAWYKLITI